MVNLRAPKIPAKLVLINLLLRGEPHAWKRAQRSGARTRNHDDNVAAAENMRADFKRAYPAFRCISQRTLGTQMYFETLYDSKDIDNLEKQVNDAMQGVIWHNDCKIKEVYKRVVVLPSRTVSAKQFNPKTGRPGWTHQKLPAGRHGCMQLVVYLLED